jgi:hypothetical protein
VNPMFRRILALILAPLLALQSASAGVNSHQAKVSGGTKGAAPVGSQGFLDTTEEARLIFKYRAGTNGELGKFPQGTFEVPYASIDRFVYGDAKHLRVGQTIALSALAGVGGILLLLSKSHTHYLSIDYRDATDQQQVISFEVGKDAIRPLIESLEVRTGKKVEYEAGPPAPAKPKP